MAIKMSARVGLVLICMSTPLRLDASTIVVNSTDMAVVENDGKCTLIEAMENARFADRGYRDCLAGSPEGNAIELGGGQTYVVPSAWTGAGTAAALGLPLVSRHLTINGHGATLTRAADSGEFRLLYVVESVLTLNDVTISDIVLPDKGDGAVYNDNGTLNVARSTFRGMRAGASGTGGGAVTSRARTDVPASVQSTLYVTDSAFEDNESRSTESAYGAGAGINTYAVGSGASATATIVRSRFRRNTATNQGAGVSNAAYDGGAVSTTTIERSSITENTTTGGVLPGTAFGGGVVNFAGNAYSSSAANARATLTITNTTIAGNEAAVDGYGGGIFNELDCGFMVPCGGGAIVRLALNNVTLYDNTAGRDPFGAERGGGVWSNNNDPTGTVEFSIRDSLIAGNLASGTPANCHIANNVAGGALGYNIASDGSCGAGFHVFTLGQIDLGGMNTADLVHYRSPRADSVVIDKAACNVAVDQSGMARPMGAACDVGAVEASASRRTTRSDFDGDGRSDPGIFRPSVVPDALWYVVPDGGGAAFQTLFGATGDTPVSGDYDGDQRTDAVTWNPSTGLWCGPRNGASTLVTQFVMGQGGDLPVPCDYDGDGAVDAAIYQPSSGQWLGVRADGVSVVLDANLGVAPGDVPVPADYNGDGRCDPAIVRPGVGSDGSSLWYSVPTGGGAVLQVLVGAPGDEPAPGDYDGDGKADAVIYRPSTGLWYGLRTGSTQAVTQLILGQPGDIPVPGDYDGNGATDPAVYRPSTGRFHGVNAVGITVVLDAGLGAAPGDIPTDQRPSQ